MDIDGLTTVNVDNFHVTMFEYISSKKMKVDGLKGITKIYLDMLKDGYYFIIDKTLISGFLTDIAYVLNPNSENEIQVVLTLIDDDEYSVTSE